MNKRNKGITLIALVITIIILIILSAIAIRLSLGENGLFNMAKKAKDEYINSTKSEEEQLNILYNQMNEEELPENTLTTNAGTIVKLPEKWSTQVVRYISTQNGNEIKDTTKVSTVYAVAIGDGKSVPVPYGFYYVGGNLDTGVIISDNEQDKYDGKIDKTTWEYTTQLKGNQFVFIPCTEQEYHKTDFGKQTGAWDKTTYSAEKTQIQKYQGFYVGRYEAGLAQTIEEFTTPQMHTTTNPIYNKEGIPQSRAGLSPWNFINWENCQKNSQSMYNTNCVGSGLITGTAWDVILNKIVEKTDLTEGDLTNSSSWGNYHNNKIEYKGRLSKLYTSSGEYIMETFGELTEGTTSSYTNASGDLLTTGASKQAQTYNMYDIAGNLWEFTEESSNSKTQSGYYVIRGGGMLTDSNTTPACYRDCNNVNTYTGPSVGFRVMLYIK